jgi:hypothetical protein
VHQEIAIGSLAQLQSGVDTARIERELERGLGVQREREKGAEQQGEADFFHLEGAVLYISDSGAIVLLF